MNIKDVYLKYGEDYIRKVVKENVESKDYYDVVDLTYHTRTKQLSYNRNRFSIDLAEYLIQAIDLNPNDNIDGMCARDRINIRRMFDMLNECKMEGNVK